MDARTLDRIMRAVAVTQHGLVGRDQLRREGASRQAVGRRLSSPDWDLVTPRVLRLVGAPVTDHQRAMAATLDAGPGTLVSHRSAAALWGIAGFDLRALAISRPRNGPHRATRLAVVHQPVALPAAHRAVRNGIPVTTLARTVVDLAADEHPQRAERVVHAAVTLGLGWTALDRVLGDLPGRPGVALIRSLVAENLGRRPLGSGLEATVVRLLRAAGLPEPRRQVDLGGDGWVGQVDFYYDDRRLILEINGPHHDSPVQVRHDQHRTAALVAAGFRVLPLSHDLIRRRPDELVRLVAQTLALAA